VKARAGIGIAIAACALAGCGSPVTLTQDAPAVSVTVPTAYSYRLLVVRGGECPSGFELKTQYGVPVPIVEGSGVIHLIPGDYTGASGHEIGFGMAFATVPCVWTLTLTPR
jgi:hypothetical protein